MERQRFEHPAPSVLLELQERCETDVLAKVPKILTPNAIGLYNSMQRQFSDMLLTIAQQLSDRDMFDVVEAKNLKEAWTILCKQIK